MKIKLIATDLDGTLLRGDHTISERTKRVFSKFREHEGKIVLSTGRAFFGTEKIAKELGIKGIVITYNGARIYDLERDEIIAHEPIDSEHVLELIKISRESNIHLNLYQKDDWYVEERERDESKNYAIACGKEPIEKSFDEFEEYAMTKALFIGEPKSLEIIEKRVREVLGEKVHITYSKNIYLEILNKKVNKGAALKHVAEYYGVEQEKIAAFGDELNDKEMLQFANYGVAMKNANPELKKFVKYETLTNEEDGVAEFLLNLLPELQEG